MQNSESNLFATFPWHKCRKSTQQETRNVVLTFAILAFVSVVGALNLVCNYAALSHALSYGLTCSLFTLNLKKPALVLNKMPLDGCSAQYAPTTFYRLSFCNYNLSVNHVYIFFTSSMFLAINCLVLGGMFCCLCCC